MKIVYVLAETVKYTHTEHEDDLRYIAIYINMNDAKAKLDEMERAAHYDNELEIIEVELNKFYEYGIGSKFN